MATTTCVTFSVQRFRAENSISPFKRQLRSPCDNKWGGRTTEAATKCISVLHGTITIFHKKDHVPISAIYVFMCATIFSFVTKKQHKAYKVYGQNIWGKLTALPPPFHPHHRSIAGIWSQHSPASPSHPGTDSTGSTRRGDPAELQYIITPGRESRE